MFQAFFAFAVHVIGLGASFGERALYYAAAFGALLGTGILLRRKSVKEKLNALRARRRDSGCASLGIVLLVALMIGLIVWGIQQAPQLMLTMGLIFGGILVLIIIIGLAAKK